MFDPVELPLPTDYPLALGVWYATNMAYRPGIILFQNITILLSDCKKHLKKLGKV